MKTIKSYIVFVRHDNGTTPLRTIAQDEDEIRARIKNSTFVNPKITKIKHLDTINF